MNRPPNCAKYRTCRPAATASPPHLANEAKADVTLPCGIVLGGSEAAEGVRLARLLHAGVRGLYILVGLLVVAGFAVCHSHAGAEGAAATRPADNRVGFA